MDINELARLIYAERTQTAERAKRIGTTPPPYYMVNFSHPVICGLYERWRVAHGIHKNFPPSDIERTIFELEIMSAGTRQELEKHYEHLDILRQEMGPGQRNGGSADGKDDL